MSFLTSSEDYGTVQYHKIKSFDSLGFAIFCAFGVAIATWLFPSAQDDPGFSIFLIGVPMGMFGFFSHRREMKRIREEIPPG